MGLDIHEWLKNFKWVKPFKGDEEKERGVRFIGNLIELSAKYNNEVILGEKGEFFGGASFEGMFGHDLDFFTGINLVIEKAEGKLEADRKDFFTPESKRIKEKILKEIDKVAQRFVNSNIIADRNILQVKIKNILFEKFDEILRSNINNITERNIKTEKYLKEISEEMFQSLGAVTELIEFKETIITNQYAEYSNELRTVSNKEFKILMSLEQFKSQIINIEKKVTAKYEEALDTISQKDRVEKLKKEKEEELKKIDKIEKIFFNTENEKNLDNYLKFANNIQTDLDKIKDFAEVIRNAYAEYNTYKDVLLTTNNEFIQDPQLTYKLIEHSEKILKIYKKFYIGIVNKTVNRKQMTTTIFLSETNLESKVKSLRKSFLNLVYYTTLVAKHLDNIEANLNDMNQKAFNEGLITKDMLTELGLEYNKLYNALKNGFGEQVVVEDSKSEQKVSQELKNQVWNDADDIINREKAYMNLKYGEINKPVLLCEKIISKIHKAYKHWQGICSRKEELNGEIRELDEILSQIRDFEAEDAKTFKYEVLNIVTESLSLNTDSLEIL
ncbi:hypothetical protein [Nautilia lithotrophica]